jgi:hypothetical protein
VPSCISVRAESRYVLGYNHVVILHNGCEREATCAVASDVNPTPQSVEVLVSATVEVLTFMGSPAATFVAHVNCRVP